MSTDKKSLERKRQHHYVWQHYLRAWSKDKINIWNVTQRRKTCSTSIKGLAVKKDFYELEPLSQEAIQILKFAIKEKGNSATRDFLHQIINHIITISDFDKLSKSSSIKDNLPKEKFTELQKTIASLKSNFIEMHHTGIENSMKLILDELRNGKPYDLLAAKPNKQVSFSQYLAHQWVRTNRITDVMSLYPQLLSDSPFEGKELIKKHSNLANEIIPILKLFYGVTLGNHLFQRINNTNHILLRNKTKLPFITSDQPVINIHKCMIAISDHTSNPPDFTDLYYPISPEYAYMINDSHAYGSGQIGKTITNIKNDEEVHKLNLQCVNNANETIFGNSEDIVDQYKKFLST